MDSRKFGNFAAPAVFRKCKELEQWNLVWEVVWGFAIVTLKKSARTMDLILQTSGRILAFYAIGVYEKCRTVITRSEASNSI